MAYSDKPRRRSSSPSVMMMMEMEEDRRVEPALKAEEAKNFVDEEAGKDVAKILCGQMAKKGYGGGLDAPKPAPAIIKKMGMDDSSFSRQTTEDTNIPWSREVTPFSPQTTEEAPLAEPQIQDTYVTVDKPRKRASSPSMQMMQDFHEEKEAEPVVSPQRRTSKFVDDSTAQDVTKILCQKAGIA